MVLVMYQADTYIGSIYDRTTSLHEFTFLVMLEHL